MKSRRAMLYVAVLLCACGLIVSASVYAVNQLGGKRNSAVSMLFWQPAKAVLTLAFEGDKS